MKIQKRSDKFLHLRDFISAKARLRTYIPSSPLDFSESLSQQFNIPIYLKLENWQKTGSFKVRGALNKLLSLSAEEKSKGVITASAGNHGLGVAYAAKLLDVHGKIVVPENASPAKIKALRLFELELVKNGADYDEAEAYAWELKKREGLTFVHAFSDPDIIAGQGTIGLEIMQQLPDVETIVAPVGGGGLISGVASVVKAANPHIKIIGVQPQASRAMVNALQNGKVVETPIQETIADGLAGRFVTELTLNLTQEFVDDVIVVSESSTEEALKLILEQEHILVEGSAAVGVAALLEKKIPSGKCAIILTGRNIDIKLLTRLLV